ncbi:MAG TPA: CYTH domain-containing protein [Longimicrobiales bacterium]|nr:CYTH domain-containing protein [Longimicrobiales bacterium]
MSGANTETERRFLVRIARWAAAAPDAAREHLVQVYLAAEAERTVRVRLAAGGAQLTVKGPSAGGTRTEIECDIDPAAAQAIVDAGLFAGAPVTKTRSTIRIGSLVWEVDQLEGGNAGLVIAEVEHRGDAEPLDEWDASVDRERPDWIGREITGEPKFSNSNLAVRPFASWPERDRESVLREIEATE